MEKKINILVIDDSSVVRQAWALLIQRESDFNLCGQAAHPVEAIAELRRQWPDVIILDIEMPHVDGLTFLRKIMAERPTPIIICSTLTQGSGSDKAMEAFSQGAVAVMGKPNLGVRDYFMDASNDFASLIREAAKSKVQKVISSAPAAAVAASPAPTPFTDPATPFPTGASASRTADTFSAKPAASIPVSTTIPSSKPLNGSANASSGAPRTVSNKVLIAIGTSTGGPQALEAVLPKLPAWCPGIVIVQHMPANFTQMLAKRLDSLSQIEVREAKNGDEVKPGLALIAPGGFHMQIRRSGDKYIVDVADGPLVNRHKPSVDVLFRSVAKVAGKNALGVMLTGMGADGTFGMQDMKNVGSPCIAQDEASSVVWGMPGEVVKRGIATKVLHLNLIADEMVRTILEPGMQ